MGTAILSEFHGSKLPQLDQSNHHLLRYQTIPPVMFRTGDIVEAQLTPMMVPMKGGTFKLTMVLRCLTLLDSTYSRVSRYVNQKHTDN